MGGEVRSSLALRAGWFRCDEDVPAAIADDFEAVVQFWADKLGRGELAPVPSIPGTFLVEGHAVEAPGFTAAAFERAVHRAHVEGLTIQPTTQPGTVAVSSGSRPGLRYLATRTSCTCPAGRQGRPCKHRGLAIFLADVCGERLVARHAA